MRTTRILIGVFVWIGLIAGVWGWAEARLAAPDVAGEADSPGLRSPVTSQLWRYFAARRRSASLEFDRPLVVGVGDPIFVQDERGVAKQVGEITRVADGAGNIDQRWAQADSAEALFYPQAPPLTPGARLDYYATPDSLEWVVQTMLPPQKRRQIAEALSAAFEAHREEILRELRPVVEGAFRESLAVVEQDLPKVIERRRPELEKLGEKYRGEVIEKRLVPLVRKEIWPLVQKRAQPLAEEIGLEVWEQASLWRFGWRFAYDVSPLPEKDLVEKEWRRFLEEEVMPVVNTHTDDFIRLQQQILADVAQNEKVRQVVRESLTQILDDPEAQQLAADMMREAIIENPRLRETLERRWRSEETQRAVAIAATRLEPAVRRVGDLVFGTRETGISPEFAQVLRSQILHKDRRWLVLTVPSAPSEASGKEDEMETLRVHVGQGDTISPFVRESFPLALPPGEDAL